MNKLRFVIVLTEKKCKHTCYIIFLLLAYFIPYSTIDVPHLHMHVESSSLTKIFATTAPMHFMAHMPARHSPRAVRGPSRMRRNMFWAAIYAVVVLVAAHATRRVLCLVRRTITTPVVRRRVAVVHTYSHRRSRGDSGCAAVETVEPTSTGGTTRLLTLSGVTCCSNKVMLSVLSAARSVRMLMLIVISLMSTSMLTFVQLEEELIMPRSGLPRVARVVQHTFAMLAGTRFFTVGPPARATDRTTS